MLTNSQNGIFESNDMDIADTKCVKLGIVSKIQKFS